jgi:transposase-like protein
MATREDFKLSTVQKQRRRFSENFKKEKVREIERGFASVGEICKLYEVSSPAVYKWITKFGNETTKQEWIMVESKSDTRELLELRKKVAELERMIGQKQIVIDFQEKMIELAEDHYGVEIKKNSDIQPLTSSGKTEKDIPTA